MSKRSRRPGREAIKEQRRERKRAQRGVELYGRGRQEEQAGLRTKSFQAAGRTTKEVFFTPSDHGSARWALSQRPRHGDMS